MLTKFWEGLGSKFAEQWVATVFAPAFAFWLGGLLAWTWRFGLSSLTKWWDSLSSVEQVAVLAGILLLIAASAAIMGRFELPLLRLLEGYWPQRLNFLYRWLVTHQRNHYYSLEQRWQTLAAKELSKLSATERIEYVQLDYQLHTFPPDTADIMPTALGNRLRAAETWPHAKYGLDATISWPRLWLLLPEEARQDLTQTRAALDSNVRLIAWSTLFLMWTFWAWWAVPISLLAIFLTYRATVNTAEAYGDLLESVFDVYRTSLYNALRWPLPKTPKEERGVGSQVTEYLWRGSEQETPLFEDLDKE